MDYQQQFTTMWDFKNRNTTKNLPNTYRGNYSPNVVFNILNRYCKPNSIVLDQFCGSGTTNVVCSQMKIKSIGSDLSDFAIKETKKNLKFDTNGYAKIIKSNANNLNIDDNKIDIICTHPPYSNAIKYSSNSNDLSNMNYYDFINELKLCIKESYRVLKVNGYLVITIGDIRKNKKVVPLGFDLFNIIKSQNFEPIEIIIKKQNNCKMNDYWINIAKKQKFYLLEHEYIYVFKKL